MRWLFGLLLLLLFFSGCLNPEQIQEMRFECVALSSGAFAMVPECDSQEECYQKVGQELFDFDDSSINFESRKVLEAHKNYLALSWRYFNISQEELEKIRELCWSETDFHSLPNHINRLNNSLIQAFNAADEANKQALVFLITQKDWLEKQELGLVREEPLFDSLILLQNNLNQLQTKTGSPPDSFAGKLLKTQEEIGLIFSKYGLDKQFVTTEHLADLLPEHRQIILKSISKKDPILPVFGGAVLNLVAQFTEQGRLKESITALKTFPAFPFFSGYRNLVGTEDSIAQETGRLAERIAKEQEEIIKKISELQKETEEKIFVSRQKISSLEIGFQSGLKQDTIENIVRALKPKTRISFQSFEITDFSTAQDRLEQEITEIQSDFLTVIEKQALGESTIGKTLQSLKISRANLEELNSNIFFLKNEFESGLIGLCSKRVNEIKESTKKDYANRTALELQAKTRFFAEQFNESQENRNKLEYCSETIQSFENLLLFLEDKEKFESERDSRLAGCIGFLENSFETMPDSLIGLEWLWEQIKAKSKDSTVNIQELESECKNLEQKAKNKILGNETVIRLQHNFMEIQSYWNGLQQLAVLKEKPPSFLVLKKQFQELQKFFLNNQLVLEKVIPVLEEIQKQAQRQKEELEELFEEQIMAFLKESAIIKSFSESVLQANIENSIVTTIIFSNPTAIQWEQPIVVSLDGKWTEARILEKSPNIQKISTEPKKLLIWFSSVPSGTSKVKIQSRQEVLTKEENSFLFVNQFKALMQRTIEFETETLLQELQVLTSIPKNSFNVWVIFRDKEVSFSRNDKDISFLLKKVSETDTSAVFFTVPNPIQTSEKMQVNGNLIEWEIKIYNELTERIPKPQIIVALPEKSLEFLEARNEQGKTVSLVRLESKAIIELKELLPKQETTVTVTGIIDNKEELLEEILLQTTLVLEALVQTEHKSTKQEAQRLLAELLGIEQKTEKKLESVFSLAGKAQALQEKARQKIFDEQQFLETRNQAEKKIRETKALSEKLFEQGFQDIGGEIKDRIQKAMQLLAEASLAGENQEFQTAGILALKALAALEEGKAKNRKAFEEEQKEIQEKGSKLIQVIGELLFDNSTALKQQKSIAKELVVLEQSAWDSNPKLFLEQLEKSKLVFDESRQKINELLKERAKIAIRKVYSFQALVSDGGLEKKAQEMINWFKENPESEVIQAGIFLPFRKKDLEKYFQQAIGLNSEKQEEFLKELTQLFEKEEYASALQLFSKNKSKIESNLEKARGLEEELENDWETAKQKAGIALEKIQVMAEQGKLGSGQTAIFFKAQEALKEKQFLQALVLVKKIEYPEQLSQTGFFAFLDNVPAAIIPIVIAIAALVIFRMRKKEDKEIEKPKTKVERVPNNL